MPDAADELRVDAFVTGLDHPRWLYVLPNGDVLVAETNAPAEREDARGIKGWFMKRFMKKAGAAVPSADRITLLRDADGNGVAETRTAFLENLHSPFGMALVGNTFYVANTDAVMAFQYNEGDQSIAGEGTKIVDLPADGLNRHWTKGLIATSGGDKLYVSIGSNSNIAENGMEEEEGRAAIWEIDPEAKTMRPFATGLRNPVGMAWEPNTGTLWTVVNERDELGANLPPDYLTSVTDGGFYGWPYTYWGTHPDPRVDQDRPELIAEAITPDYALGAHVAPLGLAITTENTLPEPFQYGAFIGEHGSWNRDPRAGYKVVFIPFADGKPSGDPIDVLSGLLSEDGKAYGRPVGVVFDDRGALLVADDVGNAIWRVTGNGATTSGRERT
jgi:glucose/arabinose dehydrogenase